MDLADQIEIDETVVHRRDERVGAARRDPRERIVAAGGVDHEEVSIFRQRGEHVVEAVLALTVMRGVARNRQFAAGALYRCGTIVEIAAHRALAMIEVERGDLRAARLQRDRDMDRGGRFARAAFFVGKDNDMWLSRSSRQRGCFPSCSVGASLIEGAPNPSVFTEGHRPVQTIRTLEALRSGIGALRDGGASIALVPTMGALHAGHLALIEAAKRPGRKVVASIFVNPTQFGPNEDLSRYPRRESADARMLTDAGCDLLWLPPVEVMYPTGFATKISVSGVSEGLDGVSRPGHFDGVATVVAKLFNQVRPDIALFGEKDFQQLAVIRQMVADLDFGIEIQGVPTQRDDDGLALSSRNIYLDDAQRAAAVALPRALGVAAKAIARGDAADDALASAREALIAAGFVVDYLELVDALTLTPGTDPERARRLVAAAKIGATRLIDNLAVPPRDHA